MILTKDESYIHMEVTLEFIFTISSSSFEVIHQKNSGPQRLLGPGHVPVVSAALGNVLEGTMLQ